MCKLLTISIAAYNAEDYIAKAIESLILPDDWMERLDVIVVNDGSTDHTASIVEKYVVQYPGSIRLINKQNRGLGSTYNTSSKLAKGKYFRLLDADDWYCTDNLIGYLKYLMNIDADLILSPYKEIYKKPKQEKIIDRWSYLHQNNHDIWESSPPDFSPAMHELAIRTACMLPEGFHVSEHCYYVDNEYVFQCLVRAKTLAFYSQPIYCYLLGRAGQSMSLEGTRKHYRDIVRVSESIYEYCERIGLESLSEWAQRSVLSITHNTYNIFFLLDKPRIHKRELIEWNKHILEDYPNIYSLTMRDWKVKLLRRMQFSFFCPYCLLKQLKIR